MSSPTLEKIKIICEIAAFFFAAVFIFTKFIGGQANAGMEVSIETTRREYPTALETESLAISLKLKRSDIGRLEIDDVILDIIDLTDPKASLKEERPPNVTRERKTNGGKILLGESKKGIFLPPNDATQLGYLIKIKRGSAVRVEATILASRTGLWYGKSQWRASAISIPAATSER